jgi:tetratricopeptide (TPR) repeat protein
MYTGNLDRAREDLEQAYRHHQVPEHAESTYEAQGDTGVAALAYLALVLYNQGYTQDALARSDLSLELADKVGRPVTLAQAWAMRGALALAAGDRAQLGYWVEKARLHSVERKIGYWSTVGSLLSTWIEGRTRDPAAAITRFREHLGAYTSSGGRLLLPNFQILLADLHTVTGEQARALEALKVGKEHMRATGERFLESELHWFLGRTLMSGERPDPDMASAAYQRAMDAASEMNSKLLELRAATTLAVHQREIGEQCTALARVESLCRWFGPDSELREVGHARLLLDGEATLR